MTEQTKKKDLLGFTEIKPGVFQSDVDPEMVLTTRQYMGMLASGLMLFAAIGGLAVCGVLGVRNAIRNRQAKKAPAIEQKVTQPKILPVTWSTNGLNEIE